MSRRRVSKIPSCQSEIFDAQVSSPYTSSIVSLKFGSKEYSIHDKCIPKSPKWKVDPGWGGCKQVLELKDLDEDTGHTVVHYLYTDLYQTLNTPGIPKDAEVEYKRSVLAYSAAKLYGLDGLAEQAVKVIEELDKNMSVFKTLAACRHAYQHHSYEDEWLLQYLRGKIVAALERNETLLVQKQFLDEVEGSAVFTRVLFTIFGGLYVEKARKSLPPPDSASESSYDFP